MTNLQAVEVSLTGNSLKNVKLESQIFGFDVKLNKEYSNVNKDGVYLQYSILYDGTIVGFADYYYNIDTKKFSYRQSVCCTFEGLNDNEILNMEYTDIPIDNVLEPVFKVGQLVTEGDSKGMLAEDAFVDNFWFNKTTQNPDEMQMFIYRRAYQTVNEVKEDSGLYTMYAFKQPDNTFILNIDYSSGSAITGDLKTFADNVKAVLKSRCLDGDDTNYIIDTSTERTNANFEMMKELYPLLYTRGQSIADHHSTVKGYTSYEDFCADSFKEQVTVLSSNVSRNSNDGPLPVIYTYNGTNSKGASTSRYLRGSSNNMGGHNFSCLNAFEGTTAYTGLGFKDYFGSYDSSSTTATNIGNFTAEKFLKACGIENQAYINAFIAAENARTQGQYGPYNYNTTYYTERLKVNL